MTETESTRKPRRRLTPEQRIEERKAEIARIEEKQRQAVRDAIGEILRGLRVTNEKAMASNMVHESDRIVGAIQALETKV